MKKLAPGVRVKTNAEYARLISTTARAGAVVKAHRPISECWVVRFDDVAPLQFVNAYYLEAVQ